MDMVEAVGSVAKLLGARSVAPSAPASAVAAPRPAVAGGDEARVAATATARELSQSAPVDHDRVVRLKQAVASGNYPIAPEAVADQLLALKLDWQSGS